MTIQTHAGSRIVSVEVIKPDPLTISGYLVTLECGYTFMGVPHMYWPGSIGEWKRCHHDENPDDLR